MKKNHPTIHHQKHNPSNTSTRLQSSTLYHHSTTPNQQHHNHWLQQIFFPENNPHRTHHDQSIRHGQHPPTHLQIENTQIPPSLTKFLGNYLKGRQHYTTYNNQTSEHTNIKAGVPQRGVLSPTLVNICMSETPLSKNNLFNLITYADDITITSSHPNTNTTIQHLLPYLNEIHTWAHTNKFRNNPIKTTTTLMTPDPSECNKPLNIYINNIPIPTTSNPTILGLILAPN